MKSRGVCNSVITVITESPKTAETALYSCGERPTSPYSVVVQLLQLMQLIQLLRILCVGCFTVLNNSILSDGSNERETCCDEEG